MGPQMSALIVLLGIIAIGHSKVLYMKHAPSCVVMQKASPGVTVLSSDLPHVLSVPLGVSQKKDSFLQSKCVLKRPGANVLFTVYTHKDQHVPMDSMASYPVDWDVPFVDVEQLHNHVQKKFIERQPLILDLLSNNQLLDVKTSSELFQSLPSSLQSARDRLLDSDSIMGRIVSSSPSSLNTSHHSDGGLLAELQTVQDVVAMLRKRANSLKTKTPDLLSFSLSGLKAVGEAHGINSPQAAEAQALINRHLNQLTEELKSIYKGNVMVEVAIAPAMDHPRSRQTRSLKAEDIIVVNTAFPNLNLALYYGQDFPVTFNIILWLMVILTIFVIFVSYGMWNINPNLESILYRVPQDESKKLN